MRKICENMKKGQRSHYSTLATKIMRFNQHTRNVEQTNIRHFKASETCKKVKENDLERF